MANPIFVQSYFFVAHTTFPIIVVIAFPFFQLLYKVVSKSANGGAQNIDNNFAL